MADDFFKQWCSTDSRARGKYRCEILREVDSSREELEPTLGELVQKHYVDPERAAERIERLGYKKAAKQLNQYLPTSTKARSGDLGEILATEYVNRRMPFKVPIFRLRWKDGRNMALRGDDLIAIGRQDGTLQLLKGEVKSRRKVVSATVAKALEQLRKNASRPSGHTINYVIDRLLDLGKAKTAALLEKYLDEGIVADDLCHLLFVLSGNDPKQLFDGALSSYSGKVRIAAVGLVIEDHANFVSGVYKGLKWRPGSKSKNG
jgi:Cap4 SAVED domain